MEVTIEELRKNKIFVATPMFGGMCHGNYTRSMMDLQGFAAANGLDVRAYFIFNESLIPRARNYCADTFLRSNCTHLMFIDADIGFNPKDVLALSVLDKDIICGPYPKKTIAWEKIYSACNSPNSELRNKISNDPNYLANFVGDYVFNPLDDGIQQVPLNEPFQVLEAGTGFMMIKRESLEKFKNHFPQYSYKPDHNRTEDFNGSREIHQFFHCEIDPKTKRYLSEDYWYAQKSREAGLEVWMCPWMQMNHTGTFTFAGSLGKMAEASLNHGSPVPKHQEKPKSKESEKSGLIMKK